jgi:hypothetical protein
MIPVCEHVGSRPVEEVPVSRQTTYVEVLSMLVAELVFKMELR